jgi:hypothetical protein
MLLRCPFLVFFDGLKVELSMEFVGKIQAAVNFQSELDATLDAHFVRSTTRDVS